ncbi:MAG: 2OG-Fe(II) oxygenase [Woeseiaceae bacterium]
MDAEYRSRLVADAEGGNPIAERLLLLGLLGDNDRDEISAYLERLADDVHRRYLVAELQCFHGWPADESWQAALRECAAAGHPEARNVVALYDTWSTGGGWDDWQPPAWTGVISGDGLVVERSDEFAPRPLVGFLRTILGPQLQPSAVIDPDSGEAIAHPVRINQSAQWFPEQLGWIGKLFEQRLAVAGGYDVAHGEVPSLLHYGPGQRYKAHLDCISRKQAESPEGIEQGGQRTLTLLLSLGDDDYEGGETWFPHFDAGAKARTGELLRFNNTDAAGEPLRNSLHAGQPLASGEKWLLSKWVREKPTPYGREICLSGRN